MLGIDANRLRRPIRMITAHQYAAAMVDVTGINDTMNLGSAMNGTWATKNRLAKIAGA